MSLNTIEEVYELLYQQVIEMKREKNTDNFVTIEQMENMVSQQNQELLTGSLLQMLDQDILEQNTIENIDGSDSGLQEIESDFDSRFVYRVGEIAEVFDFDDNRWDECAPGIHFFMDRQDAVEYEL